MRESADQLSAAAERLLALRLSGSVGTRLVPQPGAEADTRIPLSLDQRRLWFIDQADPGILAYNVHAAYRLRGELDLGALRSAVSLVFNRHRALRARFVMEKGEPYQLIDAASADFEVSARDFSDESDPIAAAREFAKARADRRFSLARGPLFDSWVARVGEDDHVLGIVVHHIVFDRDSLSIWEAEISAMYAASRAERTPDLPPLVAHYGDYVRWQRSEAACGAGQQVEYWRRRLQGVPAVTELPLDRPRPKRASYRACSIPVGLPADRGRGLREIAKSHRTTVFAVALAALQGLLFRYIPAAGTVVVGCPVNGRNRPDFEGLMGFFAHSLPIVAVRADRADGTFSDMTAQARDSLLAAHENQAIPFDDLVRIAAPPRDLGHNPLFQIWFDLVTQSPGSQGLSLPGLMVEEFDTEQVRTRFDLEMHLIEKPSGELSGRLLAATDLFDDSTVQGFVRHYENFLSAVAGKPDLRMRNIPILAADERDVIVNEWGASR
jgi:condensation domain-containing protein